MRFTSEVLRVVSGVFAALYGVLLIFGYRPDPYAAAGLAFIVLGNIILDGGSE